MCFPKRSNLPKKIVKSNQARKRDQPRKCPCIAMPAKYTLCCKCLGSFAFLLCKMPMFWRARMKEGGKPLPLAFQYLIFMI